MLATLSVMFYELRFLQIICVSYRIGVYSFNPRSLVVLENNGKNCETIYDMSCLQLFPFSSSMKYPSLQLLFLLARTAAAWLAGRLMPKLLSRCHKSMGRLGPFCHGLKATTTEAEIRLLLLRMKGNWFRCWRQFRGSWLNSGSLRQEDKGKGRKRWT